MRSYLLVRSVLCVAAMSVSAAAFGAEPKISYYKAGDVGAFSVSRELPASVDVTRVNLSAQAADDKVYLIYLQRPDSLLERAESPHYREPHFSPKQTAELQQIKKAMDKIERKKRPKELRDIPGRLEKLQVTLNAELAKDQRVRSESRLQKTRARIETLKQRQETLRQQLAARAPEFRKEMNNLYACRQQIYKDAREASLKPRKAQQKTTLQIYGRFQGTGKTAVTIFSSGTEKLRSPSMQIAKIELNLPEADGGTSRTLNQWARIRAQRFAEYIINSPYTSYYQYCVLASVSKYRLPSDNLGPGFARFSDRDRRPDLYSMTTGALAIQESLQLDAMSGEGWQATPPTVPLASLKGPKIKSHPFEKMMEGREPKMFPAAALVPFDAYYCHFSSISKQIATSDVLKQWGASLLRAATVNARDADVPAKLQTQLCIGTSVLTRLFGSVVIGEIVLTGSDPFVREGTDFTVIIQVKNRKMFEKQMLEYRTAALKAHRTAKTVKGKYRGVAIVAVTTPDRVVSSYSAYLGNYSVYSNSIISLKRIIDTRAKRRRSMAQNLDFQYMRTIFPGTARSEDGFLYMSDAFIRKLVGPSWKIGEQRRIVCQNHLRMISNAATMYRTEMRDQPELAALVKEKYLPKEALVCPSRTSKKDKTPAYSLDKSDRAMCNVHNVLRHCTPVDSIPFDKATLTEAKEYERFVTQYNNYWSEYFDPIGIRFKVGDHIEAETCILPLIENSMYNELRRATGGKPVPLKARVLTPRTIFAATAKINLDHKEYKEMLIDLQRELPRTIPPITKCIGSSFSIGVCDGDALFTVDPAGVAMMGGFMDLSEQIVVSTILSAATLPMYGVLELKDAKLTDTVIRDLLKLAETESKTATGWDRMFGVERYTFGKKHAGTEMNTLLMRLGPIRLRLYYAIARKHLVVATKPEILKEVLDAIAKQKRGGHIVANIRTDVQPKAVDKLLPLARTGWQERMRHACHRNLPAVRSLIENHAATTRKLDAVSQRVTGVTLRCPSAGIYKHDAMRDIVYCSVHANSALPSQPETFTGREDLIRLLVRLRSLSTTLRFTKEGIMTKVELDLDPINPASGKKKGRGKRR